MKACKDTRALFMLYLLLKQNFSPNSSSSAMTISTTSKLSKPRSLTKWLLLETCTKENGKKIELKKEVRFFFLSKCCPHNTTKDDHMSSYVNTHTTGNNNHQQKHRGILWRPRRLSAETNFVCDRPLFNLLASNLDFNFFFPLFFFFFLFFVILTQKWLKQAMTEYVKGCWLGVSSKNCSLHNS